MKVIVERDYRITYDAYTGSRWRKDGALCVARTGPSAISRFKQRAGKGLRMRNVKAKRLNTRYGTPVRRGRLIR